MDDGERQYEWEAGRRLKKLIVIGDPADGIENGFDEGSATLTDGYYFDAIETENGGGPGPGPDDGSSEDSEPSGEPWEPEAPFPGGGDSPFDAPPVD